MFDVKKLLFHLSCLFWSCLRQEDKCVPCSSMSTKMEVPLQSELTECLVNAKHWLLCMGAYLIGDTCWGFREPQSCWRNMPITNSICYVVCSVQFSRSVMSHSATPWTAAHQGSLFFTNSWSLGKLMSIELVIPSNHLILCHPLSSCLQCCPVTGFFLMNQFFTSVGQSIGGSISASALPMNIQVWFPLWWLG